MRRLRGRTLIELAVTLSVAGVLVGAAAPAVRDWLAAQRAVAAINQMVGAVQSARHAAIVLRASVTLCPAARGACAARDRWHEGAMIFRDRNRNGRRDAGEAVITELPRLRRGERVYWRSFRNRRHLQFTARGLTNWQNGHFLYCPPDGDARFARQVILNAQGRARLARDGDGDGIAEDARGRPLACP